MDEVESSTLEAAMHKLIGMYDKDHRFTASDIRAMHKVWLGYIYEWAGAFRQVNVSKEGFPFAAAREVPVLMAKLEKGPLRKHTPCNFKSIDRIVTALAEVHVELVLIHPFREGNGRAARMLSDLMALQAGLPPLDFGVIVGRKKKDYIIAVQAGMTRNYGPMEKIFESVIRRTLRVR